jgi:hypothetical protein
LGDAIHFMHKMGEVFPTRKNGSPRPERSKLAVTNSCQSGRGLVSPVSSFLARKLRRVCVGGHYSHYAQNGGGVSDSEEWIATFPTCRDSL